MAQDAAVKVLEVSLDGQQVLVGRGGIPGANPFLGLEVAVVEPGELAAVLALHVLGMGQVSMRPGHAVVGLFHPVLEAVGLVDPDHDFIQQALGFLGPGVGVEKDGQGDHAGDNQHDHNLDDQGVAA